VGYRGPDNDSCLELMVPARIADRRRDALQALVDGFQYTDQGTPFIYRTIEGKLRRIPLQEINSLLAEANAALAMGRDPEETT